MKKLITVPLLALLAIPAFGETTKTSTTRTYEETTSSPAATDVSAQDEMIEAEEYELEEYDEPMSPEEVDETRKDEQEKMEEIIESEEAIDYSDRTRTDRERKALNTGSDASDDQ